MKNFDVDEIFKIILEKIENNEIRTNNELRLHLEKLEEQFHIKTLHLLVAFREWLAEKGIDLSTENGSVTLLKK